MIAFVDHSPFGERAPNRRQAAILAMTASLPANNLGLRAAMVLRKAVLKPLGQNGIDVVRWGAKLRLYPQSNGCEKNLLFTPQMFDTAERRALIDAIARTGGRFTFIDIGANVGLYSLFVATRAAEARVLAIEPQPGICDRLAFNVAMNPGANVEIVRCAVSDARGTLPLAIDRRDFGGTRASPDGQIAVPARPLLDILDGHGISRIDALKIDIEGMEDRALVPFLRAAPDDLLPRTILIEDSRGSWREDLHGLMAEKGYTVIGRSRQNLILRR